MYSSIYINVRRLYTTFEVQRELDDVIMTVRQRVTSVLEDEAFIVELIETQFGHSNGVEDVVGRLERVKFCTVFIFSFFKTARKSRWCTFFFTTCFFTPLAFFCDFFPQSKEYIYALNLTNSLGAREPVFDLNFPKTLWFVME